MSTPRQVRLCAVCSKRLTSRGRFCSDTCKAIAQKPIACTSCGGSLADMGPGSTLCMDCRSKSRRTSSRFRRAKIPIHGGDCSCAECRLFAIMLADPPRLTSEGEA